MKFETHDTEKKVQEENALERPTFVCKRKFWNSFWGGGNDIIFLRCLKTKIMCCPNLESRARDLLIAVINNTLVFGFVNVILLLYCIVSGNDDSFSVINLRIFAFVVWRFSFPWDQSLFHFFALFYWNVEKQDEELSFGLLETSISVIVHSLWFSVFHS
jgi:hypothetical protein